MKRVKKVVVKETPQSEKLYTMEQLVKAYNKGFSNGIGIGEPRDSRFLSDAVDLMSDYFDEIIKHTD